MNALTDGHKAVAAVAEPDPLFAEIVESALREDGLHVVRLRVDAACLPEEVQRAAACVLIIGPSFGRSGVATSVRELLSRGVRTLVISPQSLDRIDAEIMLAGASGHLSAMTTNYRGLGSEVCRVLNETSPLHPDVVQSILRQWRESRVAAGGERSPVELTPREVDVVRGLRDGLTTRLIAARLGITEKTVEAHKSRLFSKVGAKNSSQALKLVDSRGLI